MLLRITKEVDYIIGATSLTLAAPSDWAWSLSTDAAADDDDADIQAAFTLAWVRVRQQQEYEFRRRQWLIIFRPGNGSPMATDVVVFGVVVIKFAIC